LWYGNGSWLAPSGFNLDSRPIFDFRGDLTASWKYQDFMGTMNGMLVWVPFISSLINFQVQFALWVWWGLHCRAF
jgi:hypothetical protein